MAWIVKKGTTPDGRGRYLVRWKVGGRTRSITRVGEKEAKALKRQIEESLEGGGYIDPRAGRVKVREYAGRWLTTRAHLRSRTLTRYEEILRLHALPAIGDMALNRIRPTDLEALVAAMLAGGLAPGTVRQLKAVLSSLFKAAVRDGLLARSPVEGLSMPQLRREEQRFLTAEEVARLAGEIDDRYRALVLLGAYGALRFGELAGLKTGVLRLLERKVDVVWQVGEDKGHLVEGPPKWGSSRTVTIPRAVADELARHIEAQPPGPNGLLFTAKEGGPLRHGRFIKTFWRPAVERAGLSPLRPHDLRHTAVALSVAAGAHPKEIQEMLGHRSITTTLNTYGHLFPQLHERLADRLDETFEEAAHLWRTSERSNIVALPERGRESSG